MRILVADDSPHAADTLAELLRLEFSCRVFVAHEGEQALHLALAERPDIAILDIRMPRLSGIEVARRVRAACADAADAADARPRLIAVTGELGINERWSEIDDSFDAAYAKPIDIGRLIADVTRHWRGQPARPVRVRFDVQECFTRAVRDVLPLMAKRRQTVAFDCSDVSVVVEADELGLRSGLYRLMAGLADVIEQGFVLLHADVRVDPAGAAVLTMTAGGIGELAPAARIDHVLERLAMSREAPRSAPGARRSALIASGRCPSSGGVASFSSEAGEGALFRLEWACGVIEPQLGAAASAAGARAWVVDADGPPGAMLERRLQRFGWRVRRFDGIGAVLTAIDDPASGAPPALVVVHEADAATARRTAAMAQRMPAQTVVLLLVTAGSPTFTEPDPAQVTVRLQPLSPGDIDRLTEHVLLVAGDARDGPTSAWATEAPPRSRVLVVDDNDVNRMVASGLVTALGYDVVCASDGLDAIEQCKTSPPDVVLMDVNMPVLDGIDATRRLRELQRCGRVAPFAIVAATAASDDDTERSCRDAGMDGFLSKPLRLPQMRNELRRVTAHRERS